MSSPGGSGGVGAQGGQGIREDLGTRKAQGAGEEQEGVGRLAPVAPALVKAVVHQAVQQSDERLRLLGGERVGAFEILGQDIGNQQLSDVSHADHGELLQQPSRRSTVVSGADDGGEVREELLQAHMGLRGPVRCLGVPPHDRGQPRSSSQDHDARLLRVEPEHFLGPFFQVPGAPVGFLPGQEEFHQVLDRGPRPVRGPGHRPGQFR